jgi:aspartyl-tRNA(Asn)/glutamyl-tRNA(Gln) amidotransferase subunit A
MARFFERYDVLLTPTAAALPWTVDAEYPSEIDGKPVGPRGHAVFTPLANHAGLPAISVPAGWTEDCLPVGLQIVGPYLSDARVLRTAAAFEQARPWADRWPPEPSS